MNFLGYAEFVCTVNLPINEIMGGSGGPTVAEAKVKGGKKKEAVVQCAQEACRILNQFGLLRQSNHEARKKRQVKNCKIILCIVIFQILRHFQFNAFLRR